MSSLLLLKNSKAQFPFLSYTGVQRFQLNKEEAFEIENYLFKINEEIKSRKEDIVLVIQLYIQLILIIACRSYQRQGFSKQENAVNNNAVFNYFVKLVGQHFLSKRKVSDYAKLLHITAVSVIK